MATSSLAASHTSSAAAGFFVAGGTLSRDAACYVTRQADEDLLNGLRQGQFCYVLTSRQMGKSSLMVRAAMQLRQEGVSVAVLDLTAIGQNLTPEQWYDGLLNRIGRQLDLEDELEDFWNEHERLGPLARFLNAVRDVALARVTGSLVIFIDEVDAVRSLPFSTDEFFAGIRECYNARVEEPNLRRLTFALFGVASPSDLIRDVRTTPFNIGNRIELRDFTAAEAAPLAEGLNYGEHGEHGAEKNKNNHGEHGGHGEGIEEKKRRKEEEEKRRRGEEEKAPQHLNTRTSQHPLPGRPPDGKDNTQHLLSRVLYWTNGHPYMTMRLLQAVGMDAQAHKPADVDRICEELFLSSRAREADHNLLFVRERLLRSETDRALLLDMYAQIRAGRRIGDDETNPVVSTLRLAGIVRAEQGRLKVRNRIYAHVFDNTWVRNSMPDAVHRLQKAAYRLGQLRTGAIASILIVLSGALTVQSYFLARANARLAQQNAHVAQEAQRKEQTAMQTAQVATQNARRASQAEQESRMDVAKMIMNSRSRPTFKPSDLAGLLPVADMPNSDIGGFAAPGVNADAKRSRAPSASQGSVVPTAAKPQPSTAGLHPKTSVRLLMVSELQNWSYRELMLAVNEIFARHGYIFHTPELKQYFAQFAWYKPRSANFQAAERQFNKYELANAALLARERNRKRPHSQTSGSLILP